MGGGGVVPQPLDSPISSSAYIHPRGFSGQPLRIILVTKPLGWLAPNCWGMHDSYHDLVSVKRLCAMRPP